METVILYSVTEVLRGPTTGHLHVDITTPSALRQLSNSEWSPRRRPAHGAWSLGQL